MPEVASVSASYSSATPWYRTVTPTQWRVLAAAKLGWMLDAMDFMLFAMAIGQLRAYLLHERRDGGTPRNRHAGDVGRRWNCSSGSSPTVSAARAR